MKISIDSSVFLPGASAGVVKGNFEVDTAPVVGTVIKIINKSLVVEHVLQLNDGERHFMLGDINLRSRDELEIFIEALESRTELYFNSHLPNTAETR